MHLAYPASLEALHSNTQIERFDENDYEYEIFSIVISAHACRSVTLAGKRGSRRHSTTSFSESVVLAGTSYQMLEVLAFCNRERS